MHLNFADRVVGKSSHSSSSATAAQPSSPTKALSLARAFTTSVKGKDKDATMGRSATTTQRAPLRPSQISLPVALISTTNMLSYDAPDLAHAPLRKQQQTQHYMSGAVPRRQASTVSSATSDSSSLRSRHSNASHSTAGTSLSVEGFSPDSPENHLTCYFRNQTHPAGTRRADSVVSHASSHASSPHVPSRATSHSMKAHVMSHKRSVSTRTSASPQTSSSAPDPVVVRRDSTEMFSPSSVASVMPTAPGSAPHPFGKELEQLSEVAEEFSSTVRDVEQTSEIGALRSKGLGLFCATEYMQEIAPLFTRAYGDDLAASTPTWI